MIRIQLDGPNKKSKLRKSGSVSLFEKLSLAVVGILVVFILYFIGRLEIWFL